MRRTHYFGHVLLAFLEFYLYDVYVLCHISRRILCRVCTLNVIVPVRFSRAPFLFPLSVYINSDVEYPQARNQTSYMIIVQCYMNQVFHKYCAFSVCATGKVSKISLTVFGELVGKWILIFKGNEDLRFSLKQICLSRDLIQLIRFCQHLPK